MKQLKDYEYYRTDLGILYKGDCLEILPLIKDKIDLVLTDTPYGIGYEYDGFKDNEKNVKRLITGIIELNKNRCIVFPSCNIEIEKWIYKTFDIFWRICWYKGSTGHASKIGFCDWEMMFVFNKPKKNFIHDYYQTKLTKKEKFGHPCSKPIEWAEWIIKKFTDENDIVMDCCTGSGTTAVACEEMGRRWIGIEMSEKYCEIAKQRIKNEYDKLKLL